MDRNELCVQVLNSQITNSRIRKAKCCARHAQLGVVLADHRRASHVMQVKLSIKNNQCNVFLYKLLYGSGTVVAHTASQWHHTHLVGRQGTLLHKA